jgi:hypothetical protein
MINPCANLQYSYDENEFADFANYCLAKYKKDFVGSDRPYPWTLISNREDSQKFKKILQNLFDIFEAIGQPLVANEPKIFWSNPMAYGPIHKDPIGSRGTALKEYSKWACNIPAVNSDKVFLEFFDESLGSNANFLVHPNVDLRYGAPDFYLKYKNQNFEFGDLPEEQSLPYFSKSWTDTMILDTTKWHRSRSYSDQISIRLQYFTYWDLQKSYQETISDLKLE